MQTGPVKMALYSLTGRANSPFHADDSRIARQACERRAEVKHRIETIEAALTGLDMILPAAADVVAIDQILTLE